MAERGTEKGPGWHTGQSGLPTLRKGWQYDRATRRTTKVEEAGGG